MALEFGNCDFETASLAVFDDYAGPPTFPSGVAHAGTYCCRIEPVAGTNNFGTFPDGSVVGVSSAGAKKIAVRCYMRINSLPDVSGSPQESYARLLSIGGPQNGHAVLWLSGDPTSRGGRVLSGRIGLSVNTAQLFGPPPSGAGGALDGPDSLRYDGLTWSGATVATGVWHLVLLTVSYSSGGAITASVSVGGVSLSGPDGYTSAALGTPFAIGQVALGNNGSDWDAAVSVDFDDVVYSAGDGPDAAGPVPPDITIDPVTLPDGLRDAPYSQRLMAAGGFGSPYSFSVISGALPDGLSLDSDGLLSGTPMSTGSFTFTVRATDGSGSGDHVYTVATRGVRVEIATGSPPTLEDHTDDILQADFELGLNQRSTAHLVFKDGFMPARLAEIVLYARDGVTPVFGGIILRRRVRGLAPQLIENATDADVVDFSIYFDDASVTLSYDAPVAVEDVIADVVDQVLGDYGLTYTPTATGLTMQPFSWVDVVVTTAFKQISDKTGIVFRTSPLKEILAFVPGTDPAPITISDSNINTFDLTWTDGEHLTANTVELFCGPSGPGMMRQQWIADGVETSWVTDLPAIDPPPILVEVDDGVTPYLATVVPLGTGGGQFEWDRDTHTLSLGTDPTPASGTKITLGSTENFDSPFTFYTVQFPFKVRVTTGDLPPITHRESRPDVVENAAAIEIAEGILARESEPRRDLEVLTDVDGFLPGQALTVDTIDRYGLDADFLVASVRAVLQNAEVWDYTITTQEESAYRGSYVDDWKALTQGGGAAGTDASLTAPVTPPTPTAGTGDVTGPSSSVNGEAVLFDGTTGKLLKRATGTGLALRTSGVESVLTAPADATQFLCGTVPPTWAVPSGGGKVVDMVHASFRTGATGTTAIPMDNTVPQQTEGDEYMTLAHTPADAANILRIDVVGTWSPDVANWITAALFQDSTANALASMFNYQSQATGGLLIVFTHWMVAGTTSSTTFKVRAGRHTAAGTTITFNGESGAQRMGGTMASSITITEIVP